MTIQLTIQLPNLPEDFAGVKYFESSGNDEPLL